MPYQGLIFAAILGIGLAVVFELFLASEQLEEPQTYERTDQGTRRRNREENSRRRRRRSYNQVMCPICQENLLGCHNSIRTLGCNHKFHEQCIQNWFQTQGARRICPVCREPATS